MDARTIDTGGKIHLSRSGTFGLDGCVSFLHSGTCSRDAPQSASFIMNDGAEKLAKGPPLGISPLSLLKDKFIYLRYLSVSKDLGITPVKLFLERSNNSKLVNVPNDSGIGPWNLLFVKERD